MQLPKKPAPELQTQRPEGNNNNNNNRPAIW